MTRFVPMSYNRASIDSMIRRALSICSTYQSLAAEFDRITRIGRANNYPLSFVHVHSGIGLSKYLMTKDEITSPTPPKASEDKKKRMYVEIPYVGQTTISIKRKYTHLSSKRRPDLDIHYLARPPSSVQSFFQNKDPIAKHMQSNMVYSVKCKNCEQTYVGKTDR
jgi:hypothetical protein